MYINIFFSSLLFLNLKYYRKISDEMKRLSEELKKDYKQMKSNKWKMSDIVNKWWESMIGK